jgi:PAS domain S-box-containing protein
LCGEHGTKDRQPSVFGHANSIDQVPTGRVLIIEDDAGTAELQQRRLRRAGFETVIARTLDVASRELEDSLIDVVVLDHSLADCRTGLDFFEQLHSQDLAPPTILVTGFSNEGLMLRALRAGVRDFVPKSGEYLDYLPYAVCQVLAKAKVERALQHRMRLASLSAEVGAILLHGGSQQKILATCAQCIGVNLDAEMVQIWTLHASGIVLERQGRYSACGLSDESSNRLAIGEKHIGQVARDKSPSYQEIVVPNPRASDGQDPCLQRTLNSAGLPLMVCDRLVGVMEVCIRGILDPATRQSLEAIANQLALGIERMQTSETKEHLAAILEATPDLVGIANIRGSILYLNPAGRRILGVGADEDISQAVIGDFHPTSTVEQLFNHVLPQVLRSGPWTGELRMRRRDGHEIPVSLALMVHRDADGQPCFMSTIARDVTERKRAETRLRLRERALEVVSEGIVFTDPRLQDNPIVYVNPAFERITGYRAADVLGRNCRFLQGPKSQQDVIDVIQQAISRQESCAVELVNYRADGTHFWNAISIAPLCDERGQLIHFVWILSDATQRRGLEEQVRHSQKMEAVGRLAGGIAHDFNNVLTIILGNTELALEQLSPDSSALKELFHDITDAGQRAAALTGQLLAFSRKQVLEQKIINLNSLVANLDKMLRRLIGEDMCLATRLDPELGLVKADSGQIEQIIMNLAVNARDAMSHGGSLMLETRNVELDSVSAENHSDVRPGKYVLLSVRDTGCGMEPDTLAHIFEPFFTTKRAGEGTGMGLAMVFGIVRQSGGHVTVDSELGCGATFNIYLPRSEEPCGCEESRHIDPDTPRGEERVLLVEDEPQVRLLARRILENSGYTVLEAGDGATAIQRAEQFKGPIHLLVTDVVMPGMSGREVADNISIFRPDIKVLYVSGYTNDAIVREGVVEDGVAFLRKPYDRRSLSIKVRQVLDS